MKLILFDFDGVLVDTLGISYSIAKEVNKDLALEKYKTFFEGNIYNAINDTDFIGDENFFAKYQKLTRELKVPEILFDLVEDLSSSYLLAIVSSSPAHLIKEILDRDGSSAYFADILGQETHTSKVKKIKMLLEKYKVGPEDAVYITDTVGDILEARECGVKSIAVIWGFHDEETLRKANPAKIVSTPEDLLKSIQEF